MSHMTGCVGQDNVNTTILVLFHQVSTVTWGFIKQHLLYTSLDANNGSLKKGGGGVQLHYIISQQQLNNSTKRFT